MSRGHASGAVSTVNYKKFVLLRPALLGLRVICAIGWAACNKFVTSGGAGAGPASEVPVSRPACVSLVYTGSPR